MERASEKKLLFLYEQKKSIWFEAQLKNTETQLKSVIMARYFSESSTMKNIHIYTFFLHIYSKLTKFSCNPSFSLSHILKGHGNCFSFFAFTLYVMWLYGRRGWWWWCTWTPHLSRWLRAHVTVPLLQTLQILRVELKRVS